MLFLEHFFLVNISIQICFVTFRHSSLNCWGAKKMIKHIIINNIVSGLKGKKGKIKYCLKKSFDFFHTKLADSCSWVEGNFRLKQTAPGQSVGVGDVVD